MFLSKIAVACAKRSHLEWHIVLLQQWVQENCGSFLYRGEMWNQGDITHTVILSSFVEHWKPSRQTFWGNLKAINFLLIFINSNNVLLFPPLFDENHGQLIGGRDNRSVWWWQQAVVKTSLSKIADTANSMNQRLSVLSIVVSVLIQGIVEDTRAGTESNSLSLRFVPRHFSCY